MESMKELIFESWMFAMRQKTETYVNYMNSLTSVEQYFVGFHKYHRKQEKLIPVFTFQSTQLEQRGELVKWLILLQSELTFSTLALHSAIHLMDFFLANHEIATEKLKRVAVVCMLLAVSFEDQDDTLPKLPTLFEKIGLEFNKKDIMDIKFKILKFCDFNIGRSTVAHFTHMYSAFIVDQRDLDILLADRNGNSSVCIELYDKGQIFLRKLLDECLSETQYLKFDQSLVASVCILAVRKSLNLFPCWTKMLQFITDYTPEDLNPCIALYNTGKTPENQISTKDFEVPSSDASECSTSSSCYSPQSSDSSST